MVHWENVRAVELKYCVTGKSVINQASELSFEGKVSAGLYGGTLLIVFGDVGRGHRDILQCGRREAGVDGDYSWAGGAFFGFNGHGEPEVYDSSVGLGPLHENVVAEVKQVLRDASNLTGLARGGV